MAVMMMIIRKEEYESQSLFEALLCVRYYMLTSLPQENQY